MGLTGILVVFGLVVSGGVPGFKEALYGFAQPVPYFLIGVLTIGLAVSKSGLAERVAGFFLKRCKGSPRALYFHMVAGFPLLTLLLPSATTRSGILVHVYERALEMCGAQRTSPLAKSIMMALNSLNRLASTMILTGGITPIVSAALVGGLSWSRWFILLSVPYGAILAIGAVLICLIYRRGFKTALPVLPPTPAPPLAGPELRAAVITLCTSVFWLTDALHHLHPSIPAVIAWTLFLSPRTGVLTWKEFEQNLGWANFFVLAASLSLAQALLDSGVGFWIAARIGNSAPVLVRNPRLIVLVLLLSAPPVRLLIPNITGFLAITIPIAMSVGEMMGLNPVVCGLLMMIAGDAVLYYPAQSASSLVIYERGYLSAPEIFRFGLLMTGVGFIVVLALALPYWAMLGEGL
jgi:anion transporter